MVNGGKVVEEEQRQTGGGNDSSEVGDPGSPRLGAHGRPVEVGAPVGRHHGKTPRSKGPQAMQFVSSSPTFRN